MLERTLSFLDLIFAKIFWKIVLFNIYKYEKINQKEGVISLKIENNLSLNNIANDLANLFFSKLHEWGLTGTFVVLYSRSSNDSSSTYVSIYRNKVEIFRVTIVSPNEFVFCLFNIDGSPKGGSRFKKDTYCKLKQDAVELFFNIVARCKIRELETEQR